MISLLQHRLLPKAWACTTTHLPHCKSFSARRILAKLAFPMSNYTSAAVNPDPHHSPPTEIFTGEDNIRVELLRILPQSKPDLSSPPHNHLILLPGNPGVIEFYRPFLLDLAATLPTSLRPHTSIHALGLPGHDLRYLNDTRVFGIDSHVDVTVSYVRTLSPGRLIFLGHSYGSHLALRVLNTLPLHRIQHAALVMLMPCLWRMAVCAGAPIRFALCDPYGMISWMTWFLTLVIPPVLIDITLGIRNQDPRIATIMKRIVDGTRHALYSNILSLGREEKKRIDDPRELRPAVVVGGRALMACAPVDRWCPPEAIHHIVDAFKGKVAVVQLGEGVQHAFVLRDVESQLVAEEIGEWLTSLGHS